MWYIAIYCVYMLKKQEENSRDRARWPVMLRKNDDISTLAWPIEIGEFHRLQSLQMGFPSKSRNIHHFIFWSSPTFRYGPTILTKQQRDHVQAVVGRMSWLGCFPWTFHRVRNRLKWEDRDSAGNVSNNVRGILGVLVLEHHGNSATMGIQPIIDGLLQGKIHVLSRHTSSRIIKK